MTDSAKSRGLLTRLRSLLSTMLPRPPDEPEEDGLTEAERAGSRETQRRVQSFEKKGRGGYR
jgi:hypothetical protein